MSSSDDSNDSNGSDSEGSDDEYEGYVSEEEGEGEVKTPNAPSLRQSTFQTLRQVSYDVIDEEKLDNRKTSLIQEVSEQLCITHCEASLLLLAYKWNKEQITSEWFDDKPKCCMKAGLVDSSIGQTMALNGGCCVLCKAIPPSPPKTATATTATATTTKPTKPTKPKATKKPRKIKPGRDTIAKQLKKMKKKKLKFTFTNGPQDMFHLTFPIESRGMWTGITHHFDVTLPTDFPFSAPTMVECNEYQGTLHPNIDPSNGNVCINTLRESWSPSMSLEDICWTLAQLFAEPGWDHSLNPNANTLFDTNKPEFFKRLKSQGATDPQQHQHVTFGIAEESKESISTTTAESATCTETACLGCNHYVCNDCWSGYLTSRVTTDRLGCVYTRCPTSKCDVIVNESMFKKYCSTSIFQDYERYVLASYMADSSFAKYCPKGGCNRVIEYKEGTKNRVIECLCGHEFCFTCEHEGGHAPLDCNLLTVWKEERTSFKGKSSDELWFAQNVKKCPKKHGGCDRPINKNGGCMHMTCRKEQGGCGFEFCWLCLGPWSKHGSSTGGYYACNNYTSAAKSGKLKGEAKAAYEAATVEETHKAKLAFYEFYVTRHVFM